MSRDRHDSMDDNEDGDDYGPGGGEDGMSSRDVEIREQDRFLPVANIARIMKKVLPNNAKIAKDAKEGIQECVSEFISFITSEASDKCQQEKRKTINGDDLLWAMSTLGFDKYVEPLKLYLLKYRESVKGEKPEKKPSARALKDAALNSAKAAAQSQMSTLNSMIGLPTDSSMGLMPPGLMSTIPIQSPILVSGGSSDAMVSSSGDVNGGITGLAAYSQYLPYDASSAAYLGLGAGIKSESAGEIMLIFFCHWRRNEGFISIIHCSPMISPFMIIVTFYDLSIILILNDLHDQNIVGAR